MDPWFSGTERDTTPDDYLVELEDGETVRVFHPDRDEYETLLAEYRAWQIERRDR